MAMKPILYSGICAAMLCAGPCSASSAEGSGAASSVEAITADYPVRALREGRQGTVIVQVTVAPDGRPKSCLVSSSSGHADLDRAACTSAMRAGGFPPISAQAGERHYLRKAEFRIEE